MDRRTFFDRVRADLFAGRVSATQVDGLNRIVDEAERRRPGDLRILAYRLATVFHETGKAMQPIEEGGGEAYLRKKPYWPWYGRGLVQCTWDYNYAKFGCASPADMLTWPFSLRALFDGMDQGVFTGRKIASYFTDKIDDPAGARHVINGSDKAALIATYHGHFLTALKAASVPAAGQIATMPGAPVLNGIIGKINQAAADEARAKAGLGPAGSISAAPAVRSPGPVVIAAALPSLLSRLFSLFRKAA